MYKCELCRELSNGGRPVGKSDRVIFHSKRFAIVPSLGPLHPHHVLLCSRRHVTGLHQMTPAELHELEAIFRAAESAFYHINGNNFVSFENGGDRGATPACSVLHYHMHMVPTSRPFETRNIGKSFSCFGGIRDAANAASVLRNYLLVKSPRHPFEVSDRDGLPSQYMRKLVAECNGCIEWDWRRFQRPTSWLEARKNLTIFVESLSKELECYASGGVAA